MGTNLLLADDSITIQKVVNLTFADEGMNVTTVGNGDLALAKIHEMTPDIVMLDVHMPGLNGYEICEKLKLSEKYRNIPVILLVGSFEPFDENEARRVGADDFLTKPFQSIRQLINKVGSLLHDRPAGANAPEPPIATSEDEVVEYEVAPGQELPGARQAIGVSPRYEEVEAEQVTWAGNRGDLARDAGLDDELIETHPVTDSVTPHETYSGGSRETRPLSALEADELSYVHSSGRSSASAVVAVTEDEELSAASDEPILDLGDIDGSTSVIEEDAVLDLGELEMVAEEGYSRFDQADGKHVGDPAEASVAAEVIPEELPVAAAPVPEVHHTEVSNEDVPYADYPAPAPVEPPVPAMVAESAPLPMMSGNQLSPEMIDAIARRVVEQLTDNAVREIAWEVVPQLAELYIKRQLEEQKK
jgi:CheY-like chemotaxis protein